MPGKHFDLDIDNNLGGENASHNTIASQKAVKSYIDTNMPAVTDTYDAESSDGMSGKAVASAIEQSKTSITFKVW